jgi:hypothetical protein
MSGESLLVILLVGLIAGWLAGQIVKGTGFGLVATFASESSALCYCPDWGSISVPVSWPPLSPLRSAQFCFWSFSGSSADEGGGELVAAPVLFVRRCWRLS